MMHRAPSPPPRELTPPASPRRGTDTPPQMAFQPIQRMNAAASSNASPPQSPRATAPPGLFDRYVPPESSSPRSDTHRSFLDSYWNNWSSNLGGQATLRSPRH